MSGVNETDTGKQDDIVKIISYSSGGSFVDLLNYRFHTFGWNGGNFGVAVAISWLIMLALAAWVIYYELYTTALKDAFCSGVDMTIRIFELYIAMSENTIQVGLK
jgi:polyferredoxin